MIKIHWYQVCSSCSLRNTCEKAYLLTNKEDEARTIDVMRLLLTFGFDPINGSVVNKSLLKQKSVRTVVRKLLHEVVKLSSVPIDPNLSPPVFKKPPPKVKQPPPPPKRRVGRDDIEMKKGDWLCPKYVNCIFVIYLRLMSIWFYHLAACQFQVNFLLEKTFNPLLCLLLPVNQMNRFFWHTTCTLLDFFCFSIW